MIISKTPLRISFFGGGTDYPDYFRQHGGAVLSTSINKYVYVTVNKLSVLSEHNYKATYSKIEHCQTINEIIHPSIRECLRHLQFEGGVEIHTICDLPAKTGLGSSSSFTVGLLNALHAFNKNPINSLSLAKEAIYVEQKLIGEKVGVQDQCAAAVGGLNYFEFKKNEEILYTPVVLSPERTKQFKSHLILFYTGVQRFAEDVLHEQIQKTKTGESTADLSEIRKMVDEGFSILNSHTNLTAFGELLHQAWESKKKLSSAISNTHLNSIYTKAMDAGATGGKLLGAGGGGFFLFFVNPDKHNDVRNALKDLQEIEMDFDNDGSKIIFTH